MSAFTDKLISYNKIKYNADSEFFMKNLKRVYEFEEHYYLIPIVQLNTKLGMSPQFVRYFPENKEHHLKAIEQTYELIIKYIKKVIPQEEINPIDEDHLIGYLVIYDGLIN